LLEKTAIAADIGIAQGATLATFYALSANARTIMLAQKESADAILFSRMVLIVPLAALSYFLSAYLANAESWIALAIILRRSIEWINEVHLTEAEQQDKQDRGTEEIARHHPHCASVRVLCRKVNVVHECDGQQRDDQGRVQVCFGQREELFHRPGSGSIVVD